MDEHKQAMQKLCRLSSKRCPKQPQAKDNHGYNKLNYQARIKIVYNIDVQLDDQLIHSEYLCKPCVATLSKEVSTKRVIQKRDSCTVCGIMKSTQLCVRPPKPQKIAAKRRK